MSEEENKQLNVMYVEMLADFVKHPITEKDLQPSRKFKNPAEVWESIKHEAEEHLLLQNILEVQPNGAYKFLVEEYKWIFRETLEDL